MKPLVSVVIPAFGRPASLAAAVRSAAAQRDLAPESLEIVVVDDASPAPVRLPEDVRSARLVRLERNGGAAVARNAGIAASAGRFVAFLDSDDVWLPDKLARQVAWAEALSADGPGFGPVAIGCSFYMPDRRSQVLELRRPVDAANTTDFAGGCWMCPGSTLLVERSVFESVGVLDGRLRRLEDYEWLLRFAGAGGRFVAAPVAGAVIAPSTDAKLAPVEAAVSHVRGLLEADPRLRLPPAARRRAESYLALELTAANLGVGRRAAAAAHLVRSLALWPRLTGSTGRFWQRSRDVPTEVERVYRDLVALAEAK
ncbi:MAG: glycosyltransferase family 2 protein [Hyphomicrobiaceae bacterium]|nr:glycosyltransferase family 2 protein [Hyphomicrobiaceae bacterium]